MNAHCTTVKHRLSETYSYVRQWLSDLP